MEKPKAVPPIPLILPLAPLLAGFLCRGRYGILAPHIGYAPKRCVDRGKAMHESRKPAPDVYGSVSPFNAVLAYRIRLTL